MKVHSTFSMTKLFFAGCNTILPVIIVMVFFTQQNVKADNEMHLGEDGILYDLNADPREGWLLGKIEPVLSTDTESEQELNVIVFVKSGDVNQVANQAKAAYQPTISSVSNQISSFYREKRPQGSLMPEEEEDAMEWVDENISADESAELQALKEEQDRAMDQMRWEVSRALDNYNRPIINEVADFILENGGEITARIYSTGSIGTIIPPRLLEPLAQHEMVASIIKDHPVQDELEISVDALNYDDWWDGGYDGGPFDFGIMDSGVQEDHPAFSGITFYSKPGSSVVNDHGTHVSGIVASADSTFRGGAFGLDAIIWATRSSDPSDTVRWSANMDNMDWIVAGATQTPEVLNLSQGWGKADDTDYSDADAFVDSLVSNFDVMVTKSAGNEGWDSFDPSITHPAPAYNILVVANMDDNDTVTISDDVRSTGSSVGPTVNERKKPDIAAPGTNIMSTNNSWSGTTCGTADPNCWTADSTRQGCQWSRCSGTSMAAPHVAAAIILMQDGGNTNPLSQKAVLLNTANGWTSNNTSSTTDDGAVAGSHWDKSYGWGYLDMGEAYYNRTDYFIDSVVPRNDNATPDDYNLYRGQMYKSSLAPGIFEKTTMTWTKRSNYVAAGEPTLRYGLSDLNLRLYSETNGDSLASDLGVVDNVHQVDISSGNYGWNDVVIKAYAWSTSFSGTTEETYALATEENFERADPPSFQRNYSRPNYVGPFQTFDVTVRIFNNGDVAAHNNVVTLDDITGVTVNGTNSQTLPSIVPGPYPNNPQETVYSLTTSGIGAGTHWLPLSFASNCYAETYTYSTTNGVSIIVETTPPVATSVSASYANSSPIEVSFTASDAQTGVRETRLYVIPPGGSSFTWTGLSSTGNSGTFQYSPSSGNGLYQFAARGVDNGGTWESYPTISETSVFYDTIAPTTTLNVPDYDTGSSIPLVFSYRDTAPSSGIEFVDFWYKKGISGTWTYTGLYSTDTSGTLYYTPVAGDGVYYFTSRGKDNAQNLETEPVGNGKDSTIYDTVNPESSSTSQQYANTSPLSVTWTASDATSGVDETRLFYKKESGGIWSDSGLTQSGTSGSFNFTPSSGDGTYYFATRARDNAGRQEGFPSSSGDTQTIFDTGAPSGTILINDDDAETDTLLTTLTLAATDVLSGVETMRFSNNGSLWSSWENYVTTYNGWALSGYGGTPQKGTKTIYVQFRDYALNVSSIFQDSIDYQPNITVVPPLMLLIIEDAVEE